MPLATSTVAAIDRRAKDDPDFAAGVEEEFQAMRIEQKIVALRNASGWTDRRPDGLADAVSVSDAVN